MKERPILFSGPMVRAILDGKKTQTRRVMKPQPEYSDRLTCWLWDRAGHKRMWDSIATNAPPYGFSQDCWIPLSPYGQRGDRLWVRESFFDHGDLPDGTVLERDERIEYRASEWNRVDSADGGPWKPSIHMPRWASRITLELTDVRVQRVQEIADADVEAEGIEHDGQWWRAGTHPVKGTLQCWPSRQRAFERLWNELNDKRGYSWHVNPWVWALTFKRVESAA